VNVRSPAIDEALRPERSDLIARVRQLDPESSSENVERFFREIDAASNVLQQIDASRFPLPVAYDPRWTQDPQ
jgi:hypothetical protein